MLTRELRRSAAGQVGSGAQRAPAAAEVGGRVARAGAQGVVGREGSGSGIGGIDLLRLQVLHRILRLLKRASPHHVVTVSIIA